jgi:hypothetical protein
MLSTLDLLQNASINRISISRNPLTSLNVSAQSGLIELYISNTQISTIDLSGSTQLVFVEALNTSLISLDLSNNSAIRSVYVGGTNLTSLDLRNGNLSNIGYVETDGAPNLTCIFVDDSTDTIIDNWLLHVNNNILETNAQCTALSTEKFENITSLTLYPNPVRNNLFIKSKDEILKIEIYNLLGKKIIEKENSDFVNVSHLKSNIYLVKISSKNGSITQRVIKY